MTEFTFGQEYPFRTFSIEEGLSESVVYDIVQDDDGYIWLATGYGLNRFDGIRFQNYFEEEGLNSSRIRALFKDEEGRIWIGSESGVNYWLPDSVHQVEELASLQDFTVISIYQDQAGDMWFGTDGQGVWQYNEGQYLTQYSTTNGLAGNRVQAIEGSESGEIWFGTREGITVLSDGNFRNFDASTGLPGNLIQDIEAAPDGNIWIGSNHGLTIYNGEKFNTFTSSNGLSHNNIQSLSITDENEVWIGTESGVSHYSGGQFKNYSVKSGLSTAMIYSSMIDLEGNIWLGTYGGGVNLFLGNYVANFTTEHGLPNNLVTSFTEDRQGRVWIATFGGGVTAYKDGKLDDFGLNEKLPDNQIYYIFMDSRQRMWFGMGQGLAYLENGNLNTFSDREFPYRTVRHIMEASDGSYWISTYDDGIFHYNGGNFIQIDAEDGLASNRALRIVEGDDGSIWVATYGGITRYMDGEFQNFAIQEGLPNNAVMNVFKDDEGRIWASTFGGIAWFDGLKFQEITPENGLPDRVCYFITQNEEGLYWIGTTNGVVRFNADYYFDEETEDQSLAFKVINKELGLIADELNLGAVYEDEEEQLWFGTVEGLSRFSPKAYRENPVPPKVHIVRLNASGREYQPEDHINLTHEENYVEIQYAGINFTAPNQILYEYKLSEIDPDWQQTTDRFVKYPSLPPGEYTFQVHARNINGAWSENITKVRFSIKAPYYMQWWFWVLMFALVVGIIYLFYNYYRARKMVDIERMRVRIASDLHDDVGASLTEIALQSDFLQAGDVDPEIEKSLQQIGKQSRKIVSSLDDIVWSIDARNDTLGDLTDRMQDYVFPTLESKNMTVNYDFDDLKMDHKLPVSVKENLYLIFKEAVNNISKYSNGDQVHIKMKNQNGKFELCIHDNGTTGKGTKKTGHGLRNMDMRAQRIGANVTINTNDGFMIKVEGKLKTN